MPTGRTTALIAVVLLTAACGGEGDDRASGGGTTGTSNATISTTISTTGPTAAGTSTTEPGATAPTTTAPTMTAPPTVEATAPPTAAPSTTPPTSSEATEPESAPTIRSIIDSGAFMNLAHAGGDQASPHSTMFAFAEAVRAGATALELDVQLTADGVLIVQHDDTVDKTTEATGPVADLTLTEIQALDNAYWFSPDCWPCRDRPVDEYVYRGVRAGDVPPPTGHTAEDFRVETFRDVAEAYREMPLDIEIKGELPGAAAVARQLALEIDELERTDSVVVVSFDDAVVDVFHELAPEVAVSPGLGRLTDWFLGGAELEPHFEVLQLPPFRGEIQVVDADVVRRVHDEGRIVWVWPDDASTQENAEFYSRLIEYGVDGIIAGRPADATAALADDTG